MTVRARPRLVGLRLGDLPERWAALGFAVSASQGLDLGGIELRLGAGGPGITGWTIGGIAATDDIDGLPTETVKPPAAVHGPAPRQRLPAHPNGAVGIDHVVALTPDFERTAAALAAAGIPLRRVREVGGVGRKGGVFRQGFRRLGPAILELVEATTEPDGPARFWGLVVIVDDLDALAGRLGHRLDRARAAVQPGRRIATLREDSGLGVRLAFMDPERLQDA